MKKALIFGLLAATVLPLAACGDETPDYSDKDFDGLYDSIDPTPDSNITGYKNSDGSESKEILVKVDYRKFIAEGTPHYDRDIGVMMAIIANNSYVSDRPKWSAVTSKYENEESKINHALVQFGFNEIEHVVTSASDKDPFDMCGLYLGNHILENEGKKYQIFVASMEGYPQESAWISNLDLGADTQAYYDIDGDHPEWTNKKHHKGFDVTANRAFNELKKYMDKKANEEVVDKVVLVTGHSRGGALTNLVGKQLFDNGIKSLAYAFNNPLTTSESDEAVLKKYTNIFNIHSTNDYIGRYPFTNMHFTSYGNNLEYDLTIPKNATQYKNIYKQDFVGNSPANLDLIDEIAKDFFPSREEAYAMGEAEEYEVYATKDLADEAAKTLNDSMVSAKLKNYAKVEVVENDDILTKDENPWAVTIATRPYSILKFACEVLVIAKTSDDKLGDIANMIYHGKPFVLDTALSVVAAFASKEVEIDVLKFAMPHIAKTCVVGAMVAE